VQLAQTFSKNMLYNDKDIFILKE